MSAWLVIAALGAPGSGVILLDASPDAEVVVFPRVEPTRIDVALYGNREPLADQLDGVSTQHLRQGWATSIGGGTWFVTLHVDRPDVALDWTLVDGRLTLRLAVGPAPVVPPADPPTVVDLLDDPPPRRPAEPQPLTLHPLRGDASTVRLTPEDAFLGMPSVSTPEVATYRPSLAAIDSYREVWTTSDDPAVRGAALARAGVAFAGLGQHRDALHYLQRALDEGRSDPATVFAIARSQAAMGRVDDVRSSCRYAARRGGAEQDVLACLAAVALLGGAPSPTHVGRALAEATERPHRKLLAAQLLQSDHRHEEALPILRRLTETGHPRVMAALGDALQATGDLPGAVDAWRAGARSPALQPAMSLRLRMAEILVEGPAAMPKAVPMLFAEADRGGAVGAEAHYLLAQIGRIHADPDLVAEQLNQLWDEAPETALRSDAPERLIATCDFRGATLAGKPVERIHFFENCWRRELDDLVADPSLLVAVSRDYAALGLVEDALATHLRAMAIDTRLNRDDPASLAWLAALHQRTERPREALETVAYVRERAPLDVDVADELLLVEGKVRWAEGDEAAAEQLWARVAGDGPAANEARQRRAWWLAEQGQCDAPELLQSAEGQIARARCALRAGRAEEAAAIVAATTFDDSFAADADWLRGVAGAEVGAVEADGVWKRLVAEEAASAELLRTIRER